jgi:hypothetical protein
MINATQELTLVVTAQEANLIFSALAELPYRIAQPMVDKLRQQILAIDPAAFDPPNTPATGPNGAALQSAQPR